MEIYSGSYKKLYIFAERVEQEQGGLFLSYPDGESRKIFLNAEDYRLIQFELPQNSICVLEYQGVKIIQMYLGGCDDILERGICFLDSQTGAVIDLSDWYDSPVREQYHFNPFINWINDPNGLCWYQGYYHLFYQSNPFAQVWGDMYWGHAVSRDLIHWTHLPHVLEPQKSLWSNKTIKGGAFSGSAVVEANGIRLYLTRHEGPLIDDQETREWQTQAICQDGITINDEEIIIDEKPFGAGPDFRDPKVQCIRGRNYMVVAAALDEIPSILLYEQSEADGWVYQGPLLQEPTDGISTFECPDFFELDDACVALGAWMSHYDEHGRFQMSKCYIGTFDGHQMTIENQHWFDFGSNLYAVQTFEHEGRRLAIGWVSDFYNEHVEREHGARGSFSLPRELSVKDNRLYMMPAKECYELLDKKIADQFNTDIENGLVIPGNSYYMHIKLNGDQPFTLVLARDGAEALSLVRQGGEVSFASDKKAIEGVRFPADVRQVRDIEIFVDRRMVEVYLNKGEGAGTKVFYQNMKDGYLKAEFSSGDLAQMEIWTVTSIWK